LAIFPDRWGVVAVVSGVGAMFSLGGIMGFYEFPITGVQPLAFGAINGVICAVTWRLHRSLKFNQVRSIAERSEAIINASQKDIEKLETLFKTDPYRDIENQKEEGIDGSINDQKEDK
tara:strand:- start:150 stop:503 length:354 start_codon:yes stop_codon:yes gene_type:complete